VDRDPRKPTRPEYSELRQVNYISSLAYLSRDIVRNKIKFIIAILELLPPENRSAKL
jgi:hypothetical protein